MTSRLLPGDLEGAREFQEAWAERRCLSCGRGGKRGGSGAGEFRLKHQALRMRVTDKSLVGGSAYRAEAHSLRNLVPPLCDAAARDHDRHAHLCRLDDHFAGEAACGVKNLIGLL